MVDDKAVTICVASGQQITDFQKMLYQIYCIELRWFDRVQFPEGIFTDAYDPVSVFLTVYAHGELISGVRLVYDSDKGYPHEYVSHVPIPDINHPIIATRISDIVYNAGRSRIMEITRFIGKKSIPRIHTYDLMKAMYWFSVKNSIQVLFMAVDLHTFLQCYKLGFQIIPVGIPFFCEGSWVIPAVQLVEHMVPEEPAIREYFLDQTALVGEWHVLNGNRTRT